MKNQEVTGDVVVSVDVPEMIGTVAKHHQYRIHGNDDKSEFEVRRRYSDFIILKNILLNRWPGFYIPALPQKKYFSNAQINFVQTRRKGLQQFLKIISEQNCLWYSQEIQLFLKNKTNDVQKLLACFSKVNHKEMLDRFSKKAEVNDSGLSEELNKKIMDFRVYLRTSLVALEKVAKVTDVMGLTRNKFHEKYKNFLCISLPSYQQQIVAQYTDKQTLWFTNAKINGLQQNQTNMMKALQKNPLYMINELIKQQIRQIQNFQQIINHRTQVQSNKNKCATKVKQLQIQQSKLIIKKPVKQQTIQKNKKQLQKAKQQLKNQQNISLVIDFILVNQQFGKFKTTRQSQYYHILKQMATIEKDIAKQQEQFWGKIAGQQGQLFKGLGKKKVKQVKQQKQQKQQPEQQKQPEQKKQSNGQSSAIDSPPKSKKQQQQQVNSQQQSKPHTQQTKQNKQDDDEILDDE